CEYSMYASDITRSVPVSGHFTARQREIYDVVLGAQKAAIDAFVSGKSKIGARYHTAPDGVDLGGTTTRTRKGNTWEGVFFSAWVCGGGEEWAEGTRMRELGGALQAILSQSGERNALVDEFLDLCTIHGADGAGEPRLAREFLKRI